MATGTERQRRRRAKLREKGVIQVTVEVPKGRSAQVKQAAKMIAAGKNLPDPAELDRLAQELDQARAELAQAEGRAEAAEARAKAATVDAGTARREAKKAVQERDKARRLYAEYRDRLPGWVRWIWG